MCHQLARPWGVGLLGGSRFDGALDVVGRAGVGLGKADTGGAFLVIGALGVAGGGRYGHRA